MSTGPSKRGIVVSVWLLALVAIVGGGWLLVRLLRGPAVIAEEASPPRRLDALVLHADPGVQRTVAGGGWAPARAGDALAVADSIRTGAGGTAELELGRGSRVTVAQRTEVAVRELNAAVQRVGLLRGRIGVNVEPDGTRVVRVEDQSGAMHVSADAGRLGVVAARSSLAVAAEQGRPVLASGGSAVEIPAGHQSTAWRGRAPTPPAPIPRALLMRVVRAIDARRASVCNVQQVDLAAEVTVDGEPVDTPQDGRLVLRVPPRGRRHGVELVLRHASGAVERHHVPCWDDEGDVSDMEVRWNSR